MGFAILHDADAVWRASNSMGVQHTDLGRQLGCVSLGARFWRLEPGQASTRHRHRVSEEVYVVIQGTGRMRIGDEAVTLPQGSVVRVDAGTVRQIFNDTGAVQRWLVVGAPTEPADTRRFTDEQLRFHYPDGVHAMPPELAG